MAEYAIPGSNSTYFGGQWPFPATDDPRFQANPVGVQVFKGESIRSGFWLDVENVPFTLDQVIGWGFRMRTAATGTPPPYLNFQWMIGASDPGAYGAVSEFAWNDEDGSHNFVVYSTDADGVGGYVVQSGGLVEWMFAADDPSYVSTSPDWPVPSSALAALLKSLQANGYCNVAIDNAPTPDGGGYIVDDLALLLFYADEEPEEEVSNITGLVGSPRTRFYRPKRVV